MSYEQRLRVRSLKVVLQEWSAGAQVLAATQGCVAPAADSRHRIAAGSGRLG